MALSEAGHGDIFLVVCWGLWACLTFARVPLRAWEEWWKGHGFLCAKPWSLFLLVTDRQLYRPTASTRPRDMVDKSELGLFASHILR